MLQYCHQAIVMPTCHCRRHTLRCCCYAVTTSSTVPPVRRNQDAQHCDRNTLFTTPTVIAIRSAVAATRYLLLRLLGTANGAT
mmetsp:Transcript_22049/g.46512  ORF Transcript_22049/g.46512 Transcript_22049/m.46512 type:complete len:83 (+) Transcript_22049:245-493(+)